MKVFVVNIDEKPLMPTTPRKARLLLRGGHAVVFRYNPFTIRLTCSNGNCVQPVVLGIDPGYSHIGISASTEKQELYSAEYELRTDITEKFSTRREWRRTRRSHLRHRKPRFNNRRRLEGWLAPSVRSRLDAHFFQIKKLSEILPISKIRLEIASFDIQKIKNPEISGTEYQQGDQFGFWNVREYVLWRDGHICRNCHGKSKDKILNVHHIESRKTGGNAPNNLVTLCETCHKAFHQGKIKIDLKRGRGFKPETFMGVLRRFLWEKLKSLNITLEATFGYITKNMRISLNLLKTHYNDAFCITGQCNAKRCEIHCLFKQVRRRGRQINKANKVKGGKWLAKRTDWDIKCFHRFDKVLYEGRKCFIWSLRKRGTFLLKTFNGEKAGEVSFKKLKLLEIASSWLSEVIKEAAIPRRPEGQRPLAESLWT